MDKTVLFANGCSMTYGSGLFEDPNTKACSDNNSRLAMSWPGVLGRDLGFSQVINLGYPGSSNDRIVRTSMEWILKNGLTQSRSESLFVVIGWSGPMRREFYINGEWRQLIPYHDYIDPPASMLNRIYREVAWSEYESAIRFANQIITLQSFLYAYKIPYLFFDAIISFAQTNIDSGNSLDFYLPYIRKENYLNLDNIKGDMATQVGVNASSGERGHPASLGHAKWAQQLANFVCQGQLFSLINLEERYNSQQIILEGTGTIEIFDRKIGLSQQPPSLITDRKLAPSSENRGEHISPKNNLWTRLRRAKCKDPFIYE